MPTTNDPYSRPINATSPTAALVGEHYGERSKHSVRTVAAGNASAVAAAPYRGVPVVPAEFVVEAPKTRPRKGNPQDPVSLPLITTLNTDATSPSDDETPELAEPVITEEDLFG